MRDSQCRLELELKMRYRRVGWNQKESEVPGEDEVGAAAVGNRYGWYFKEKIEWDRVLGVDGIRITWLKRRINWFDPWPFPA